MRTFTKILSILLALMIAASAILLVSCGKSDNQTEAKTGKTSVAETTKKEEEKFAYNISFTCVDADGKEQKFDIKTNEKTLRGALEQEKLIEGDESEYGLYVKKVCGISADWDTDKAYWALYEGENMASTGVDGIELQDGGTYKFVYTKG